MEVGQRRITWQTEAILAALLSNGSREWWGAAIAPLTGLKSGTLYPALMRMEGLGWLESWWEDVDPKVEGRPRKRFYRLTGEGEIAARTILAGAPETQSKRRASRPVRQPIPETQTA